MKVLPLEFRDDEKLNIGIEVVKASVISDIDNTQYDHDNKENRSKRKSSSGKAPVGKSPNHKIIGVDKLLADDLFKSITAFANKAEEKLKDTNASEVEIEFGLSGTVDSGSGVSLIISSSVQSAIKVRMKWNKEDLTVDIQDGENDQ